MLGYPLFAASSSFLLSFFDMNHLENCSVLRNYAPTGCKDSIAIADLEATDIGVVIGHGRLPGRSREPRYVLEGQLKIFREKFLSLTMMSGI